VAESELERSQAPVFLTNTVRFAIKPDFRDQPYPFRISRNRKRSAITDFSVARCLELSGAQLAVFRYNLALRFTESFQERKYYVD
jgi:hypothetical protein